MSPIQLGSQRTKLRTNAQERDFAGYSSSTEELANPEDGRNGARGRDMVSEQTNCEGSLVRSVRTIEESKVISAGS